MAYLNNGSVPVKVAARVYGKDPSWIRSGIIFGWLPIGIATIHGKAITGTEWNKRHGRINYYISPMLLFNETGYEWKGERE